MSGRNVFQIFTPHLHPSTQKPIYFYFECALDTLEGLVSELNGGRLVIGHRLWTMGEHDERGFYHRIRDRQPIALSALAIATVQLPQGRIVAVEE